MPMTAKKMIKHLQSHGFITVSQKGSHRKLKNFETGRITVVPMHESDLKKGTEQNILKQAGLK